jgi:hypothetical protein
VRQAPDGFFIRGHACCDGRGALQKWHGTRRLTSAIEMHGDRRAHVIEPIGKQELHSLSDSPVHEAPTRRSDAAVCNFADAVVAEFPPLVFLHADDVPLPELVERVNERVFLEIAGMRENVESEISSHCCRDLYDGTRLFREQAQSLRNDRLDAPRRIAA